MDPMDHRLISIFTEKQDSPAVLQSMRDVATLSAVLGEIEPQAFNSPQEVLRFLRILQLLNEEALGLDEPIINSDTLFYRYQNRFPDPEPPSRKRVAHVVNVLVTNNWISRQSTQLKMRDLGKRMMDVLIRLANDSLAYYLEDDIGRSLFQARRDAELSEAYDDHGISGGNKIASLIRNVEDAVSQLKARELELLADRNALPQLQKVHHLMTELQTRLNERIQKFKTLDESLVLTNLMQKGTRVLSEGTNLSLGMINRYLKFTAMRRTPIASAIRPELVRKFIISMFDPPLDSDIPDAYQMFSFMEQDQYAGEALDGLWIPVKFASPLSGEGIQEGVDYLEHYEPYVRPIEEEADIQYNKAEGTREDMTSLLGDTSWLLTKSMIQTETVEKYLDQVHKASREQIVFEATPHQWHDAVNAVTAIAALIGNKKVAAGPPSEQDSAVPEEQDWNWMNPEDGKQVISLKKEMSNHDGKG